jgi:hypothetical protein
LTHAHFLGDAKDKIEQNVKQTAQTSEVERAIKPENCARLL